MPKNTTASLTAQNTFIDAVQLDAGKKAAISISGTFSATVTVQRRLDGSNWRDVQSFTAAAEQTFDAGVGQEIRVGVKTGDYTSGTVACLISKE